MKGNGSKNERTNSVRQIAVAPSKVGFFIFLDGIRRVIDFCLHEGEIRIKNNRKLTQFWARKAQGSGLGQFEFCKRSALGRRGPEID